MSSGAVRATFRSMARPIEATPVVEGEDAKRLLDELENVCPPDEAKRRVEGARRLLAKVMVAGGSGRPAALVG